MDMATARFVDVPFEVVPGPAVAVVTTGFGVDVPSLHHDYARLRTVMRMRTRGVDVGRATGEREEGRGKQTYDHAEVNTVFP